MTKNDKDTTLQELKDLVAKFRDERGWAKYNTLKNLAISISIEAGELLEHFQWDDYTKTGQQQIADELADIILYSLNFADTCGIDIASNVRKKLETAAKKYPVEIFNGEDTAEDYRRSKLAYRRKQS